MNWEGILTNVTIGIVSGAAGWVIQHITKLRRDVDSAFKKIRTLEEEQNERNAKHPDKPGPKIPN